MPHDPDDCMSFSEFSWSHAGPPMKPGSKTKVCGYCWRAYAHLDHWRHTHVTFTGWFGTNLGDPCAGKG